GSLDPLFNGHNISPAGSMSYFPWVYDRMGQFGDVTAMYPVRCIAAAITQSDGTILFCGSFPNVDGQFRPWIARLRSASTLDPAFPVGLGPVTGGLVPARISGLSVDIDGKVWVSGNFVEWDGFSAPGYVRLNTNGTVDTKCIPQSSHFASGDYSTE